MAEANLIASLLEQATRHILSTRRFPESTYRLQFHSRFTFRDAHRLVPYLHELGITDCYASPYLKARPGSQHGYDIQDHRALNPEIGTEADYNAWVEALRGHGMGQLFDMVPNHMGIVGNENVWWNDVLENGPASPYANFFDIDWFSFEPKFHYRVLLPILGDSYGQVLESGQLSLRYEAGAFAVYYFNHRFPIAPCSYERILGLRLGELEQTLGEEAEAFVEYQSILTAIRHLPPRWATDPIQAAERQREKEVIKRRLAALAEAVPPVRDFIAGNLALLNGKPGDPPSFDRLDELLDAQAYRLCLWRVATDEINFRRFFDVNELAALSMERLDVFLATHELVFRLLREGKIAGLRIDHPDGLYDPRQYLERLQHYYVLECVRRLLETDPNYRDLDAGALEEPLLAAIRQAAGQGPEAPLWRPLYVIVEKILGKGEPIPEGWPVYGTTGYEFLNMLNGLFVDEANVAALTRIYQHWTGLKRPFADLVYQKKFLILQVALSGELHMLGHQLDRLSEAHRWSRDFTLHSLRHALREIIACFPVYRSYLSEAGIPKRDPYYILAAVARAKRKNPAISASIFDFVRDMLLLKYLELARRPAEQAEQYRFVGKFQQVTAPVMAKGVEDTAFYVYNRLLSLNEVGGDPDQFGVAVDDFHAFNRDRQRHWPHALSATSTHDSKRSEDVRARLNALSELPREWQKCLARWNAFNKRHRVVLAEEELVVPDRNEEYLIYQTLLGAWPLEPYSREEFAAFVARIQAYVQKAIHEAKEYTSWINPNPVHEEAIRQFVARLLDEEGNRRFLVDFRAFQRRLSHYGLFNSLAQTLLKITSPGAADIYQGQELWDYSLVDPDNRRPVDYELRRRLLGELRQRLADPRTDQRQLALELTAAREDGRIKLYVTSQALRCRRDQPGLFATGAYLPLAALGSRGKNVCAFARCSAGQCAIVAVPRLMVSLLGHTEVLPLGWDVWKETALGLPEPLQDRTYRNLFTGETFHPAGREGGAYLRLGELLANFPVALLLAQDEERVRGEHP